MPRAYSSTVVDMPADRVWSVVRDFNGLATWHGGLVKTSRIEDGKAADQVGCVRDFYLHDGAHLRERLLAFSDSDRFYTYNFELTPFDVQNYCATLRVTPVTDGDRSFVEWWTTFDCATEKSAEWVDTFANGVFKGGLAALRQYLAR